MKLQVSKCLHRRWEWDGFIAKWPRA